MNGAAAAMQPPFSLGGRQLSTGGGSRVRSCWCFERERMEPRVFRDSRKRALLYLAGLVALAMVSTAAARGGDDTSRIARWISAILFLLAVGQAWITVRPRELKLDGHGFTVRGGFVWKPKAVSWAEAGAFFVQGTGRGTVAIAYEVARPVRDFSHLADLPTSQKDIRLLPSGWDESPELMVSALTIYRQSAIGDVARSVSA